MSFSKKSAVVISDYWYAYRMFSKTRAAYRTVSKYRNLYDDICLSDEQKQQIDDLYSSNFGEKTSYNWHRLFTAASGKFSADYVTEIIYNVLFEQTENLNEAYRKVLADKNFLSCVAKGIGVNYPDILLSYSNGVYRKWDNRRVDFCGAIKSLENSGSIFVKPSIDSNSGKGCFSAHVVKGVDEITGNRVESMLENLGSDFIVQRFVKCQSDLQLLHAGSVGTFRINTYRWKNEFRYCPIVLSLGNGNNCLANANSNGVYVGVYDDGALCRQGHYDIEHGVSFLDRHPTSEIVFSGYKISGVDKLIQTAIRAHEALSQLGSFNWDFTIDETGSPVLIEANVGWGGAAHLSQVSFGKGHFREHTAEILRWLRVVKKTPLSKRKQYMFGYGVD